ncbi:S8 family serine peptidase [Meridianimarinicoccus roseus]|nr:S8 family serine peptidase [Meridianimarinicoccus roseus]
MHNSFSLTFRGAFVCLAPLLSGCAIFGGGSDPEPMGGAGGGGLVLGPTRPALLPEPMLGSAPVAWLSREYANSNGLALISAAEGYAIRQQGAPGGQGRRVAILDSGVDATHPEFANAEIYAFGYDDRRDLNGHGTHVAGTATARRDGAGVHGVAYNAQPVSLKVMRSVDVIGGVEARFVSIGSDLATGILSAAGIGTTIQRFDVVGNPLLFRDAFGRLQFQTLTSNPGARSDVMNMSLGVPDPRGQVFEAMSAAARAGTIMVSALGNDSRVGPSAAPGIYTDRLGGLAIGVAALDPSGTRLASFSNTCGALFHCISAPGEGILSTVPAIVEGTNYGRKSGTSMAAPHVAGAAALAQAAFPGVAPRDIVDRILRTADPIGPRQVFGFGRLNIERLMAPVGMLSVPTGATVTGAAVPLSALQATSGPGGAGAALAAATGRIMVLDSMGFPFAYDAGSRGVSPGQLTRQALDDFIDLTVAPRMDVVSPELGLRIVGISTTDDQYRDWVRTSDHQREDITFSQMDVSFDASDTLRFGFSSEAGPVSGLRGQHAALVSSGLLGSDLSDVNPVPFSGDGNTFRMAFAAGNDTWLETAFHEGDGYYGEGETQTFLVSAQHRRGPFEMSLRLGQTDETGAAAGAVYSGFASDVSAQTVFTGVDLAWQASDRVSLSAGYSVAQTSIDSGGLTRFGDQTSDAASAALSIGGVFSSNDRLTLIAALPHATRSGNATVSVPQRRTPEGAVLYNEISADLAPQAREKSLQAVYSLFSRAGRRLDIAGFTRFDADHVQGARDTGAALRATFTF